jgi:hypothetical protein
MRKDAIGRWKSAESHLLISCIHLPIPLKVVEVEVSRRYHPTGPVWIRLCAIVVEWNCGGRYPPVFYHRHQEKEDTSKTLVGNYYTNRDYFYRHQPSPAFLFSCL